MEKEKKVYKTLVETGVFVSGLGAFTIAEGLLTQHGQLGSVGALIEGAGITILLTAARKRNKI